MLPDFRVVTIAVISTFLFAVSVGFYTSSRLANERKPRPESLAAIEENPLNRIALNWPEPVQASQNPLDLDFAVTAKVLRNPVRDVTDEIAASPAPVPEQKVAAVPQAASPAVTAEPPVLDLPKIDVLKVEAPTIEVPMVEASKPEVAQIETPKIESVTTPPAPVAPKAKPDEETPTASIIEAPRNNPPSANPPLASSPGETIKREPEPAQQPPAAQVASRPDPESSEAQIDPQTEGVPATNPPAAKPPAKKAAKKKAAKKTAKVVVRPRPRIITTTPTNSFFPFFGIQQ